jgi:hypothetical protein
VQELGGFGAEIDGRQAGIVTGLGDGGDLLFAYFEFIGTLRESHFAGRLARAALSLSFFRNCKERR